LLYATLPALRKRDIRLISVLPRQSQDGDEQVSCKMEVINLDQGITYHALSYTWGSPWGVGNHINQDANGEAQQTTIICNGHPFSARLNLKAAMLRIRENPDWLGRKIWVDAVCIDQETPAERSSQVRLMADIYSSAETVMAWLGEEDEYTGRSFELIEKLSAYPPEILQQITPRTFAKQESLLGQFIRQEYWEALAILFQRAYFTRVWIIQEVVLAKHVEVFCGMHLSLWVHFENVSHFLSTSSWARYLRQDRTANFPGKISLDPLSAMTTINHSLPAKLRAIRRDRQKGDYSRTFLYALIRSRVFKASDPRDKVYALLGLVGADVANKSSLQPEYGNRHASETYLLATKQLLEDADDLLILSCIEGERETLQTQTWLPSWVPDWSCEKSLGLGVTGYARYCAAGSLPKYARVIEPTMQLELSGFKIDDISERGECKSSVLDKTPFSGWLSIMSSLPGLYHTAEDRLEVFWRTLVTNTGGNPPQYPIDGRYKYAFASWIVGQLASKYNNDFEHPDLQLQLLQLSNLSTSDQMREYLALQAHKQASQDGTNLDWANDNDPTADDYGATYSHAPHLCLFRTIKGYLGIGPECLAAEDSIWVICGSPVPLILRDVGQSNHRLVGATYLHGFMNRESSDFENVRFDHVLVV
jgi:hypothetical protein